MEIKTQKCPGCGALISAELKLCPQCGTLIEDAAKTQPIAARLRARFRVSTAALIVVLFACAMLGMIAASGVAGYYQGTRDRDERTLETAALHFARGEQNMQAKKYELATAEFEYVLQIAPDYPRAAELLAETRRRMTIVPTPTARATVTSAIGDIYKQGQAAFQAKDWGKSADLLAQVRAIDPAYESVTVENMLFTARYNYGEQLLSSNLLEEGILYLDLASELRPLDQNAATQRKLASMYLTATGYWGANWQKAIDRLSELYAIAPNYLDTGKRLIEAYTNYADQYTKEQDYCPAEQVLSDTLKFGANPAIQARLTDAHQRCMSATPTPISGTVVIAGTPVPLAGLPSGRLAYPILNDNGRYDVFLLTASGGGSQSFDKIISGGDQPALSPNGTSVAYRSPSVGINVYNMAANQDKTIAHDQSAAWPTWSPDGKRIAYAGKDSSDNWRTYIVSLDAPDQPKVVAAGWGPAWSSRGALAYTGCGAGGVCGIFVAQPDQGGVAPVKLTADRNDIGLSWSPDGSRIAYMSNHGGNWDIYIVTTAGAVHQLTSDGSVDGLPAWSPSGNEIAFVSNRGGTWGLFLMRSDGSDQRKILDLGTKLPNWQDQRLSWIP
jgi:tetratricopeptide (TPR) repeat protein